MTILAVVVVLGIGHTSMGGVVDADFEGFTAGTPVPVGSGGEIDRPIDLYYFGHNYTVENASTITGPALDSGNFLRVEYALSTQGAGAAGFGPTTEFTTGQFHFSWDALIETYDGTSFKMTGPSGLLMNVGEIYTAQYNGINNDTRMFFNSNAGNFNPSTDFINYSTGVKMHFDSVVDLEAKTWTVAIDGAEVFSGAIHENSTIGNQWSGLFNAGVLGNPSLSGAVQLDNLEISVVPEPATLCLLGLGGLLLRRKK